MPTLEEIKEQVKGLDNASKLFAFKEIKELPNILWENETLEKIIQGRYSGKVGVLVATSKRLIFIDKGLIWGLRVEDFSYDKITSIQYDTGMLTGTITIFCAGNKAEIDHVEKKQTKSFAEHVRSKIDRASESNSGENAKENNQEDILDKLERLGKLKSQGLLTEEEFLIAKNKILN